METWYQVNKYSTEITEVQVVKSTQHFLTLAAGESLFNNVERRVSKSYEYFPTFAEARTWLLDYYSRRADSLKQEAKNYSGLYQRVFMKDKPDPK